MAEQVESTVILHRSRLAATENAIARALEKTAEAAHTEVIQSQVIPFDTGNLQNESTFVDITQSHQGQVSIVHSTPYARRLYFHPEYHFSTTENPNARGEWWEPWIQGDKKDFISDTFKHFLEQENSS